MSERNHVSDRLRFVPGDFFKDPLPPADVIVMGHILHDWGIEAKKMLIGKAYAALPAKGALIVYESIIDDDRSKNAFGLLMSLNMLIETPGGFDYTRRRLHGLDARGGFPRNLRGAPGGAGIDGGGNQISDKMLAVGRLFLLLAIIAGALAAQERGALLVATEASRDTDFSRTVILLLDHDKDKATGLVLNRPVKISLAEVFPEMKMSGPDQTAWAGGPVLLGVNALLQSKTTMPDVTRVLPHVYLIDSKARMRVEIAAGTPANSFRVYLGVCGWGAGQLESEIRRGLWRVLPGTADAVFDGSPVTLWTRLSQQAREPDTSRAPSERRR